MILGGILLLLGLSIILKAIFKIDIPVFRVAFAFFLIYLGFRMLVGDFGFRHRAFRDDHTAVFSEADFKLKGDATKHAEYSVVFGSGKIDLSEGTSTEPVEISTVFGDLDIILDPKKTYAIEANSVFGKIRLPDGERVSFGTLKTRYPEHGTDVKMQIHANCVFGEIHFHTKSQEKPTAPKENTNNEK